MRNFCHRALPLTALIVLSLFSTEASAQLNANFTASATEGCSPLVVNFQDSSQGTPESWEWDLGNNNTSVLQNPSSVYNTPGRYEITLTIRNGNDSDTEIKTAFITVFGNPTSNFAVEPVEQCIPSTVQFTDLTVVGPNDDDILSWQWDFGDGNASEERNPEHTYELPGSYPVTLITTDTRGCQNITFKPDFVRAEGSLVNFTSDQQFVCSAPAVVRFQNQSTTLSNSQPEYRWDFGDGTSSNEENPVHAYTRDGIYTVSLTITADDCVNELVREDYIRVSGSAGVNFTTNTQACERQRVQFENTSAASSIAQEWDFGDGTTSFLPSPFHAYPEAGNYNVKLKLFFGRNCVDSLEKTVRVFATPTANFETRGGLCEGTPFTNISTNASSFRWDFGDSTFSSLPNPVHVYQEPGSYTVSLTASNALGCSVTNTKPIEVLPPIIADFGMDRAAGCAPHTVQFSDSTFSVPNIQNWNWDFGNGNTSDRRNPSFTFREIGRYPVTLTATNEWGCVSTFQDTVIVTNPPEFADFTISKTTVCRGEEVELQGIASDDANNFVWDLQDGNTPRDQNITHRFGKTGTIRVDFFALNEGCSRVVSKFITVLPSDPGFEILNDCDNPYTLNFGNISVGADVNEWDFGDGTTSNEFNPSHTYQERGTYEIRLTTTNLTTGCPEQSSAQTFTIAEPLASFEVENETPYCIPNTVQFTDTSQDVDPRRDDAWLWNFGDGTTSRVQNPRKSYTSPGFYTVSLTITDVNGCTNTTVVEDAVHILDLQPNFSVTNVAGCEDLEVQFTNLTAAMPEATTFLWEFGDSTTSTQENPIHIYEEFGQYDVTLTATNSEGICTYTELKVIEFLPPQADFEADVTYTCPNSEIFFENFSFNTATSFWDFGDGTTSTGRNPVKSYTESGNYTVTLTVTSDRGCVSTLVKEEHILIEEPAANFSSSGLSADCPPLVSRFSDESVGENIISWQWDFGDGGTSFLPNPSHAYTLPGIYDVKLIVTNLAGCQDSLLQEEIILVEGPKGDFVYEYDSRCDNLTVNFTAEAENTANYTWDFGDGSLGTGAEISHTYPQGGTYFPTLLLEDENGCSFFIEAEVPVEIIKPVAQFEVESQVAACPPFQANFTDNSSDNVVEWRWDFGDGKTSNQQNPVHFYESPGIYSVSLEVISDLGCRDTLVRTNLIEVNGPTGSFNFEPSDGCSPLSVTFNANSESATRFIWNFDDGNVAEGQQVAHVYEQAGTYYPTLTLTDSAGCSFTLSAQDSIVALVTPSANFTTETNTPFTGEAVRYTDQSRNATQWRWEFGDGGISTEQNPSYVYDTPGNYQGRLIVTFGTCSDTVLLEPVFIEDRIQFIPNVFSPNDDGFNDTFFVENILGDNWTLSIFNRLGNLIFKEEDYANDWNAEGVNTGLYYYELTNTEREKAFKGWVKIIR